MDTSNIQTEWDLTLLYGEDEKDIDSDIKKAREAYEKFAKKYQNNKSYLENPTDLKTALEELEYLGGKINLSKPQYYFFYKRSLNINNQDIESQINKLSQIYSKLSNKIRFFRLEVGNLPKDKQKEFLNAEELSHYHKHLKWLFKTAKFDLEESEENVLSLTNLSRNEMWVSGVQKAVNKKTIEWEGESLPLSEASSKIHDLPTKKRRNLHNKYIEKLQEVKEFSESEINAIITDKKILDEMRGYDKPYTSTIIGYENTQKEIGTLVDVVSNNFDIAHEFYELKAELLGEKTLTYADRQASIDSLDKEISFEKAVEMVHSAFADMDTEFSEILKRFLENGQIDVYPKEKKVGGAYSSSGTYLPTYVLLNYITNFRWVTILAHEMGHAIHSELSKKQTPIYQDYSIAVGETASTFFEGVVFNRVFQTLDENQKIIALHNKINSSVSTVFRQIACFNFEKELHHRIREEGSMSHEDIAKLMNKHMQSYLGDRFKLTEKDGYYFIDWSHIRRHFYVYTYSYGDLISNTLHNKYKKENDYIKKIKQFLSAGSTKTPQNVFADIGIDTSSPEVFESGLESVKKDINKLRELTS